MLLDRNKSLLNYAVTYGQAKPQQTPSVEKHAHPPRVVNYAIYPTLNCFTKFRISNLHITSTPDDANTCTLHKLIFPREAIPSHYFPLREDSPRVLAWELHGKSKSGLAVVISHRCHQMQRTRAKPRQTPSVEKHSFLLYRFIKFLVSNLHINSTPDAANKCTLHQRILLRETTPSQC